MPRTARKKQEADPEVEAALANLASNPATADPFPDAPKSEPTLEEANGLQPAPEAQHINRREYDIPMRSKVQGEDREAATRELLMAMANVEHQDASRKAVVSEWKAILDQAAEKVQHWRKVLEEGEEEVVRVEEVKNFDDGTVKVFRLDTKELISEGKLAEGEQREIPNLDAPAPEAGQAQDGDLEPGADPKSNFELEELDVPGKPKLEE